jgi:hypothetical protein
VSWWGGLEQFRRAFGFLAVGRLMPRTLLDVARKLTITEGGRAEGQTQSLTDRIFAARDGLRIPPVEPDLIDTGDYVTMRRMTRRE